jgi:ubiquinone/menaquinone biosynthesis C-methylase UbiE
LRIAALSRIPTREILDGGGLSLEETERSLADIRRVNRYAGGYRAAAAALLAEIAAVPSGRGTLLDVGCGLGDVPRRLASLAARRGGDIRVTGVDFQLAHLRIAAEIAPAARAFRTAAADARFLPFRPSSFDWVMSSLFFHHFGPEENAAILAEMWRVARAGIAVVDLRRSRISRRAVALLGPIVFRSRVSVADGRASVEQAYKREEIARIARAAGLPRFSVRNIWPGRLALTARR